MKLQISLASLLFLALSAVSPLRSVAQSATPQSSVPVLSERLVTEAVDESRLTVLKGNVHPFTQTARDMGAASAQLPLSRMLLLLKRSPDQQSALSQLMLDQQTSGSANFRAWLTPDEFGKRFGPAESDVQAVFNWLASHGFADIKLAPSRNLIEFSGDVARVREAFHTDIHHFTFNNKDRIANVADPQIPQALEPIVAGIVSLNNFPRRSHLHTTAPMQASRRYENGTPLLTTTSGCGSGGSSPCYAIGPQDFAKIYNVPASADGTGQTIAIVGETNINIEDVRSFRALFKLPAKDPNIILNGPDPGIIADEPEADLDVEWSGAIAPNAQIDLVVSETPTTGPTAGVDLSAIYIIENNLASVMSESYGTCEAGLGTTGNQFYNALWEQAAAQGITVVISAGDNGAAGCDDFNTQSTAANGLAVSGFASTPFNIAAGGTDFNDVASFPTYWAPNNHSPSTATALSYIPEVPWNGTCASTGLAGCTADTAGSSNLNIVAGSGGQSQVYLKPAWQSAPGVPTGNFRYLPDISLFASAGDNQSFYAVCQADAVNNPADSCATSGTFEFIGGGGTSAAAPAFAAVMALVNQKTGQRQGNANFVLYKLASQPSATCTSNAAAVTNTSCIFYDIASGNNSVACAGQSLNCSKTTAGGFGVLVVNPKSNPNVPAWNATAGYDLATGLGSVNVANLITKWSTATFTPSISTITAAPSSTLGHGSIADFTVKVTGAGGTPSGQISLIAQLSAGVQQAIGPFSLGSGGIATFSTILLPGGSNYKLVAQYSGDTTFGSSTSAPVAITVSKEASVTTVRLATPGGAVTTAPYGSPYILRVDVTNNQITSCPSASNFPPIDAIPCPTGAVSMTDNGAPLNDFSDVPGTPGLTSLNSQGYFEDQPIQLNAGLHTITASYAGDSSFLPSVGSAALQITKVVPASTTLTTSNSAPTTSTVVTLTYTVSTNNSGSGPSGNVSFSGGGISTSAPLVGTASGNLAAFSTATYTTTFTTAGAKTITATYTGDVNYDPAPNATVSFTVTQAASPGTFTVTSSPATVIAGNTGSSTITVTPSGGFTGTVTITCAAVTGLPPGVSCPPTPVAVNVTSNSPASAPLTISVLGPSTNLSAQNASRSQPIAAGIYAPVHSAWWLTSFTAAFAAFLLFLLPGRKKIRASLGLALLSIIAFTLGCGGGSSGGGGGGGGGVSSTSTRLTVSSTKVPSTNSALSFGIAVTSTGASPNGQLQLLDSGVPLGGSVTVSNGAATINNAGLAVGTHTITAHYLGDAGTSSSLSGALNITVTGTTSVTFTTNPASSNAVQPVTLTIQ